MSAILKQRQPWIMEKLKCASRSNLSFIQGSLEQTPDNSITSLLKPFIPLDVDGLCWTDELIQAKYAQIVKFYMHNLDSGSSDEVTYRPLECEISDTSHFVRSVLSKEAIRAALTKNSFDDEVFTNFPYSIINIQKYSFIFGINNGRKLPFVKLLITQFEIISLDCNPLIGEPMYVTSDLDSHPSLESVAKYLRNPNAKMSQDESLTVDGLLHLADDTATVASVSQDELLTAFTDFEFHEEDVKISNLYYMKALNALPYSTESDLPTLATSSFHGEFKLTASANSEDQDSSCMLNTYELKLESLKNDSTSESPSPVKETPRKMELDEMLIESPIMETPKSPPKFSTQLDDRNPSADDMFASISSISPSKDQSLTSLKALGLLNSNSVRKNEESQIEQTNALSTQSPMAGINESHAAKEVVNSLASSSQRETPRTQVFVESTELAMESTCHVFVPRNNLVEVVINTTKRTERAISPQSSHSDLSQYTYTPSSSSIRFPRAKKVFISSETSFTREENPPILFETQITDFKPKSFRSRVAFMNLPIVLSDHSRW